MGDPLFSSELPTPGLMLVESDQSRGSHFIMAIAACQLIFVTCKRACKQPPRDRAEIAAIAFERECDVWRARSLCLRILSQKALRRGRGGYFSFSYSAWAVLRIGTSGSASFQAAKKSWYAVRAFALSPWRK